MKNTFAVTATLLAAFVIGGSMLAYNRGTASHHGAETETHGAANTAGSHETTANTDSHEAGTTTAEPAQEGDAPVAGSTVDGSEAGETPAGNPEPVSSTDAGAVAGATGATGEEPNQTASAAELEGDETAGGKTFASSCAGCHGAEGKGGVGPAMTKEANTWTLEQFTSAVREGKAPGRDLGAMMPHFTASQLTDTDLLNLHKYVQGL